MTARAGGAGFVVPNVARLALLAHNEWLENKPAWVKDTCWDPAGVAHEEPFTPTGASICNSMYPIYGTVRIASGGTLGGDILKCQRRPIRFENYAVTFAPAEKARLKAIFPQGVCDYTLPGVKQRPVDGTWLDFTP